MEDHEELKNEDKDLALDYMHSEHALLDNELSVPPTCEPQRLLTFVLGIAPRYTEMEMLASHLRLYTVTLEQDVEQLRGHIHSLKKNVAQEEERKAFLEKYAAQVVKERNELLHTKPNQRNKNPTNAHYVWHTCCRKNKHHALDVNPSMAAFRGEKYHESATRLRQLEYEILNHERVRTALQSQLRRTEREYDSRAEASRKHVQQLENQVTQRAALQSSLEQKLYNVEKIVSKFEANKESEMDVMRKQLENALLEKEQLEKRNRALDEGMRTLLQERNEISERYEQAQSHVKALSEELSSVTSKHTALNGEVEALHSEIRMLRSEDIERVRSEYRRMIEKLQLERREREEELLLELEHLKKSSERKIGVHAATSTSFHLPTQEIAETQRALFFANTSAEEKDEASLDESFQWNCLSSKSSSKHSPTHSYITDFASPIRKNESPNADLKVSPWNVPLLSDASSSEPSTPPKTDPHLVKEMQFLLQKFKKRREAEQEKLQIAKSSFHKLQQTQLNDEIV